MVLLGLSVGAVDAGSVPGGTVGGARSGVLRLDEERVSSRDFVSRGRAPIARAWGDGAHCPSAARHAAERFNDHIFAGSLKFRVFQSNSNSGLGEDT
jgi:hypothetical protein